MNKKHQDVYSVEKASPQLEIGTKVSYNNIDGEIISLKGNMGDDYLMIKLSQPDRFGCTVVECLKSLFDYLVYPS